MKDLSRRFFDLEIYAIYRAIWELWGEEAWKVVWRAGEIAFDELEGGLNLEGATWPEALRKLGDYLQEVGYAEKIALRQTGDDEFEYEMVNPAILPGAKRLIAEGAVPAHISTSLMFAALKKRFGLKAEMLGDPDLRPDGRGLERWKVSKIKGR
ncbi:MAG: hypothetical protein ACUVV0_11050 [Anaerolineae bacterium]